MMRLLSVVLAAMLAAPLAYAQEFPVRPIRIIVPFPPGGGMDGVARPLAERMSQLLGQTMVLENRSGASGNVGAEAMARTPADGYTLMFANDFLSTNPVMYKSIGYDPQRDFTPVAKAAIVQMLLVVPPGSPAKDFRDLAALSRSKPLSLGTPGAGSVPHLLGELLNLEGALRVLHIPYKGSGPAVADAITGDKWNRFIFRTGRSSSQDGLASAAALMGDANVAFLAQDYAFGRDGIKAFKEALVSMKSKAKVVHEEYAPQTATDFTASAQRIFDALKDKPGRKILSIYWAGANPLTKIADMKPERYGIELAAGGNILPVMKGWKNLAGMEGAIYYYYGFPMNKMNDWLVAENQKRLKQSPDFFTAGGFAAASAVITALTKAGSSDTEKLIAAMEGMDFETPKGKMTFRKDDHQAIQSMYHFRIKKTQASEWDLLELVREIPAADLPLPVRNKR